MAPSKETIFETAISSTFHVSASIVRVSPNDENHKDTFTGELFKERPCGKVNVPTPASLKMFLSDAMTIQVVFFPPMWTVLTCGSDGNIQGCIL